jgi:hypothetical protein
MFGEVGVVERKPTHTPTGLSIRVSQGRFGMPLNDWGRYLPSGNLIAPVDGVFWRWDEP